MVQWLLCHFSGCPVEKDVIDEAARGGHLWDLQLLDADECCGGIEWGDYNCKELHIAP
ncbi:hypothetical protein PC116_g25598 [Phytophthora cactorum]|nr:hypothetical protein PC119_g24059 [Phytophthora cactorum]KAG4225988.1 hypothetical protein PC116_g25598 [Phytophthora cactorum]